ncbi:Exocyst complex component SEC6 [Vitis vinifera]|uniref:Exocyst complex component SEC6 n=1 Tax=Vitis vinifera TaxID=29760 RepID=A0A438EHA7_VITVI|nr:Exocyst complex component SEC6 [Vitis vinifera]
MNNVQVNFEDTCKGFLEVAKEAVHQTVSVIFEDPGVQELLVKLYQKGENFTIINLLFEVFMVLVVKMCSFIL